MSLTRKELAVGMISGAILFPAGQWLVTHHVENVTVAYTIGILTSVLLQYIAFKTVYGWEHKRLQRELKEQLDWSRKHCEKVFAETDRKFDEARIYKD